MMAYWSLQLSVFTATNYLKLIRMLVGAIAADIWIVVMVKLDWVKWWKYSGHLLIHMLLLLRIGNLINNYVEKNLLN